MYALHGPCSRLNAYVYAVLESLGLFYASVLHQNLSGVFNSPSSLMNVAHFIVGQQWLPCDCPFSVHTAIGYTFNPLWGNIYLYISFSKLLSSLIAVYHENVLGLFLT